jgi:hypothetical protein
VVLTLFRDHPRAVGKRTLLMIVYVDLGNDVNRQTVNSDVVQSGEAVLAVLVLLVVLAAVRWAVMRKE